VSGMIKVRGTRMEFGTISGWIELHFRRLQIGRPSRHEYARQAAIFRALSPAMVKRSRDLVGLRRLDSYLRAPSGVRFDTCDDWRVRHNALVMAVNNRIHQIESGAADRNRVRHGPADPCKMPDRALERVIQSCKDMNLVERCRAERAARSHGNLKSLTGGDRK
jgi:hypothetical protein